MQVLKDNDYRLFESLVKLDQEHMKRTLLYYLRKKYDKIIDTKDYLVAIGDIPIALVAHMDTVFSSPVKNLYYDREKGILWSPEGLGADDRAGIFAILQIIKSGLRPSVIFTTDEEIGGVGAEALSKKECPIKNLKYLIELDRCGTDDCVFYNCGNEDFIDYVSQFGFNEQMGSFSDISLLMPAWGKCGVNLSVGYRDEHSYVETLQIGALFNTINKVKRMLSMAEIPEFKYINNEMDSLKWYKMLFESDLSHCACCGKAFSDYELFPVEDFNGDIVYYCPDCMEHKITWCEKCGEPFENTDPNIKICKSCSSKESK